MNIKIFIFNDAKSTIKGGGSNFLRKLDDYINKHHLRSSKLQDSDVILLNSFPFHRPIRFICYILLAKLRQKTIVYRLDGPISLYRGNPKDQTIDIFNIKIAKLSDVTIFQSYWSYQRLLDIDPRVEFINKEFIANIYSRDLSDKKLKIDKVRKIVISSWSKNWKKGFEFYSYLDSLLPNYPSVEVDFYGRSPIHFEHINNLGPVENSQLLHNLKNYNYYLTASLDDPCSNSLTEAVSTGISVIYRQSGGHSEISGSNCLIFQSRKDLPSILEKISLMPEKTNYDSYMMENSSDQNTNSFANYINVCKKYNQKSKPKRLNFAGFIPEILDILLLSMLIRSKLNLVLPYLFSYRPRTEFLMDSHTSRTLSEDEEIVSTTLNKLPIKLEQFLESMHFSDNTTFYRLNYLQPFRSPVYLSAQVYALKLNKLLGFSTSKYLESFAAKTVNSFRFSFKDTTSIVADRNLIENNLSLKSRLKLIATNNYNQYREECYLADYRQIYSALKEFNLEYLIKSEVDSWIEPSSLIKKIRQIFSQIHRSKEADLWHLLSHVSHSLFFLSNFSQNEFVDLCGPQLVSDIQDIFSYIVTRYKSDPSHLNAAKVINGLMKLISGIRYIPVTLDLPAEDIAQICLNRKDFNNACDYLNTIYTADFCYKNVSKETRELLNKYFLSRSSEIILNYYDSTTGGFTFRPNECQTSIYKSFVSPKNTYPDLHGTLMFAWYFSLFETLYDTNTGNKWGSLLT